MTSPGEPRGDVREREEREARFFAWDVPGDAHIVALVYEPDDAERSATVVDAIATSVARRREHTLLLSAEPGPSPLDELLGGADSEGLPAALGGRARLTDVAVQRPDRPFVYLPAGHDAAAMARLLDNEMLATFIGRVRERGGTLFMAVTERTLREASVRSVLDGYVALGDAEVTGAAASLVAFGRVRFDETGEPARSNGSAQDDAAAGREGVGGGEAGEGEGEVIPTTEPARAAGPADGRAAAPGPGAAERPEMAPAREAPRPASAAWGRHRERPSFPTLPVIGGLGVVLLLAAGWWWLVAATGDGEDSPGPASVARPEGVTRGAAPAASAVEPLDPAEARGAFEAAPELPYSVQIASFADRADAEARLSRLRGAGAPEAAALYFIAPTPVRGVVYHRLFAGALATREEAEALLARLVADGRAEDAGPWALKGARLAFDLGMYRDRAAAEARVAELAARGLPAYVLEAPLDGGRRHQVYGGAYEAERASVPMAEMLDAAGEPASLIARRGIVPDTPTS